MNRELLDQLRKITREEEDILKQGSGVKKSLYALEEGEGAGTPDMDGFVVDNRKVLDEGRLIQIRTHTRFVYFPRHTHNYIEMVYMCAGTTRHIINGNEILLGKGELLIMNQYALQEILPAGEGDIAVNFMIMPEFFDRIMPLLESSASPMRDFLIECLRSQSSRVPFLHFRVRDILPVQNLLENLVWTLLHGDASHRSINQLTMGLLFLQLPDYSDRVQSVSLPYDHEIVMRALRYIEENYQDGELTAVVASGLKSLSIGEFNATLSEDVIGDDPIDVAIWKTNDGKWFGVFQRSRNELPEALEGLASTWKYLQRR